MPERAGSPLPEPLQGRQHTPLLRRRACRLPINASCWSRRALRAVRLPLRSGCLCTVGSPAPVVLALSSTASGHVRSGGRLGPDVRRSRRSNSEACSNNTPTSSRPANPTNLATTWPLRRKHSGRLEANARTCTGRLQFVQSTGSSPGLPSRARGKARPLTFTCFCSDCCS